MRRPLAPAVPRFSPRINISLSPARLIEFLIARRLWIPVLGAMLLGIVFMQVSMLSMNTGIGTAMKRSAALDRENASLRSEISRLAIGNTVSDAAASAGMVVPDSGDYRVLSAQYGNAVQRAIANLSDPVTPIAPSAPVVAPVTQSPSVAATGTTGAAGATSATTTAPTGQTAPATTQSTPASNQGATSAPASSSTQATSAPTPIVTTAGGGTAAPEG